MIRPFHLAIPVKDLDQTFKFYQDNFNCQIGRQTKNWIDLNFFGHQVTLHLKPDETKIISKNEVDGKNVPVRHFGIILEMKIWENLAQNLQDNKVKFIIEPYIRFKGETGQQATMFFLDPSNNALEFKAFGDDNMIFQS